MRYAVGRFLVVALTLLGFLATAAAQSYPDRIIRIINPFPPGGSVDITARLLAQKLSENLGHQVIVENRTGAGGNAGADSVAKSEPDGYTLLFTAPGPLVVNQTLYTKGLPFDPIKDFAPIAIFAFTPIVLMVHPGVPGQQRAGADRLRQEQSGQDPFRLGRHGLDAASVGRAAQEHDQDRDDPRAVPRDRSGHERSRRRAHPDVLRPAAGKPAADQRRQGARARQCRSEAAGGAAGPADGRGAGPAGIRRRVMGRAGGPGEDAGARSSPNYGKRSARRSHRPTSSRAFANWARSRARSPKKTSARSSMPRPRNGPRSSACPAPRRIDSVGRRSSYSLGSSGHGRRAISHASLRTTPTIPRRLTTASSIFVGATF